MWPQAKDEADLAAEQEERFREEALWKSAKRSRLQHRGSCYNCGEGCKDLFCDVECRRDYEREQRVRQSQQAQQHGSKEHPQ